MHKGKEEKLDCKKDGLRAPLQGKNHKTGKQKKKNQDEKRTRTKKGS